MANAARARAEQQDVSIAVEPADALPLALADPDQLERAAGNLVANALAAMPNGGSLELAAIRERNRVGFAVRDTGPGIASPDLARIWDPFFSRTPGGAGMGLALVRQLVDRHDGLIEVESSPGAGTTMRVLLPLATAEGDR